MQRIIVIAASLAVLTSAQTASAFSLCTYQERGCLDRVDASKSPTPAARNQCIDQYKTCIANSTPAAQARFKAERDALNAAAHNVTGRPGKPVPGARRPSAEEECRPGTVYVRPALRAVSWDEREAKALREHKKRPR